MRVRPVTDADFEELARGFKVVVDEKRWVAIQPPISEAVLAERLGERLAEGRLMFALEDPEAEVHKIELEVWPHNEAAIALYERLGFEREGLRRDHYRRRDGRLHSSVIMARLFPEAF
jgi:GNAT superfamily N-acetyltransferase